MLLSEQFSAAIDRDIAKYGEALAVEHLRTLAINLDASVTVEHMRTGRERIDGTVYHFAFSDGSAIRVLDNHAME